MDFSYGRESALAFTPDACEGVPHIRDYKFRFVAFTTPESVTATVNGKTTELDFKYDRKHRTVTAGINGIKTGDKVVITLKGDGQLPENEICDTAYELLAKSQCGYNEKTQLNSIVTKTTPALSRVQELLSTKANASLIAAMIELLSAK